LSRSCSSFRRIHFPPAPQSWKPLATALRAGEANGSRSARRRSRKESLALRVELVATGRYAITTENVSEFELLLKKSPGWSGAMFLMLEITSSDGVTAQRRIIGKQLPEAISLRLVGRALAAIGKRWRLRRPPSRSPMTLLWSVKLPRDIPPCRMARVAE